jgi:hypothetical protein
MTKPEAPMSDALAQAVARHKAADAAMDAGPHEEDYPEQVFEEEIEALDAIALMPCASHAEFIEKLRYLPVVETRLGGPPTGRHEFGSVVLAVDCHFSPVNE